MNDIYSNLFQTQGSDDIVKAMIAGARTGQDLNNIANAGESLKPESLDPVVKVLEATEKNIKLFKLFPKQSITNNVHAYNLLKSYGSNIGLFMQEGESPEQTDSVYIRKSAITKYIGVQGEVTLQAQMVKNADGKDPYTREVENKTIFVLKGINQKLTEANSGMVAEEFDGILKQHYDGINAINGVTSLGNYANDTCVINAHNKALTEAMAADASMAVVNDRFGAVSHIISHPSVFNDFAKRFHTNRYVLTNSPISATTGAVVGGKQDVIQTPNSDEGLKIVSDIFFDRRQHKYYNSAADASKAPSAPVKDIANPLTTAAGDTLNEFGTDFAGDYFYGVTARNKYGESAMCLMNTTGFAVAATASTDLKFAAGVSTYAAVSYVIYRTKMDVTDYTTAPFYPIFEITLAELQTGYDGAAGLSVRDRNRIIAGTHSAIVLDPTSDIWEYVQLSSTMKLDFAVTTLSKRFAVFNFGTPIIYQPGKIAIIRNIGDDLT
jgi:hypothetical protein